MMKFDGKLFATQRELFEYQQQYYLGVSMAHDYEYRIALAREEQEKVVIDKNKDAFLKEYILLCEKYNIEVDAICTHDGIELKYKKTGDKTTVELLAVGYK